jgi:hypothetical protein
MANQQVQSEEKKALIIGISDYADSRLPKLDFCKNDGRNILRILDQIGYDISDKNKLIGRVRIKNLSKAINSFFKAGKPKEILLFYYSGHGVLDDEGDMYLASTETDANSPDSETGFPLNNLVKLVRKCKSKVVVILDCCYSGSVQVGKGDEEAAAKFGRKAIVENSNLMSGGQGKYILSASQAAQEAFGLATGENSLFTSYLLEGLNGKSESVDNEGRVTPQSLGKYVDEKIINLPDDKQPKQRPYLKTEESGDVYLASYPKLRKTTSTSMSDMTAKLPESKESKWYKSLGMNKFEFFVPIIAVAAVSVILVYIFNGTLYNFAFNYGAQAALEDVKNATFDPSCDPTGIYLDYGGQHPVKFCIDWTNGYVNAWNSEHPGWTNGYVNAWKPRHPPPNQNNLSCRLQTRIECTNNLVLLGRYIDGTNGGSDAALSDILDKKQFNPGCDPAHLHAPDSRHTKEYCNGWTNGYISAWNSEHSQSRTPSTIQTNEKGLPVFVHLSLNCKTNSDNSHDCRYVNGTYSQLPIK